LKRQKSFTTNSMNSAKKTSQSVVLACVTAAAVAAGYSAYLVSKKNNPGNNEDTTSSHTGAGAGADAVETSASAMDDTNTNTNTDTDTYMNTKSIPGEIDITAKESDISSLRRIQTSNTITIAYASTTGTCESFAKSLFLTIRSMIPIPLATVQLCTVDELDWWDELLNNDNEDDTTAASNFTNSTSATTATKQKSQPMPPIVIFILPTWTNGTLPEKYGTLLSSLDEISHDWRVAPRPLRSEDENNNPKGSGKNGKIKIVDNKTVQVASFGMGSSAYDNSTFCKPAKDVFKLFMKLGSRSLLVSRGRGVVGMGDDDAGDCTLVFNQWKDRVITSLEEIISRHEPIPAPIDQPKASSGCCKENEKESSCGCQEEKSSSPDGGCCNSNESQNDNDDNDDDGFDDDDDDEEYDDYSDDYSDDDDDDEEKEEPDVMDLEDLGNAMKPKKKNAKKEVKEMVTPKQAVSLKKEGYRIIGTHSAVKLCRWTKHQLRGRGGCYKHTFYGITSYQCMEATPSLACANKCVFCWRHHKNPVGREWRWKVDDPHEIVDLAVKNHISLIKEAKGIPGVKKDRWLEAHTVKHCALSLVGEPIMYPRIDEFLGDLHSRKISTFLVTNGQHPDAIEKLRPITQLYVSVDASTPETLEAIDRPLFKDAWDRLRYSLKSLKNKGQRTVARLTVVKGWNSGEVEGYAKLIALGHCSLVEVKGVTFCGKSDASNLNMSNTPWHHEVIILCRTLQKELAKLRDAMVDSEDKIPEYGLACEHKHSCSVLLARVDQFAVNDPMTGKRKWRTWIDYEKFHQLASRYAEDPTFKFGVEDYVEDTPDWALFGAEEEGFDPTELRHRRKQKYPKFTKFDDNGIPTHDDNGEALSDTVRKTLIGQMEEKKMDIGDGVSVIDLKGGEKVIDDASLMFRGLTIVK